MATCDLIQIENLRVERGRFVLDVPGFRVPAGQVIGLVGPNGAGKTTLLESIAGLRRISSGRLAVMGRDPWLFPEVRCELGFMADDMPLFDMRTGPLLRMISGYYRSWDAELVEKLITKFKIEPAKRTDKLSKGQGMPVLPVGPRARVLAEAAAVLTAYLIAGSLGNALAFMLGFAPFWTSMGHLLLVLSLLFPGFVLWATPAKTVNWHFVRPGIGSVLVYGFCQVGLASTVAGVLALSGILSVVAIALIGRQFRTPDPFAGRYADPSTRFREVQRAPTAQFK